MITISFLFLMITSGFAPGMMQVVRESEQQPNGATRYLDNLFEEVEIKKDIHFTTSQNEQGEMVDLLLDIYTPAGDRETGRPVIVWIHGGGFRGGDRTQKYIVMMATRFAKKGYVCISPEYRLRSDPQADIYGTIADAVADAGACLAWLRVHGQELGVDTSKIIVGGGSAGGILASNFCLSDRSLYPGLNRSGVKGFVNLWGSPGGRWGGLEVSDEAIPTVIVHGTADQSVPYEGSVKMKQSLDAKGVKCELITYEGAAHTPVKQIDDFEKRIARFLYDILTVER
jgi:acetyl esterase/lipase